MRRKVTLFLLLPWEIKNNKKYRGEDINMGILNRVSLILCASFLGACALPAQVQMASWALDGVSMLTSGKSVTDHGISILAKKDCAIWRGVKGDDICREGEDILTAFAEAILTPAEAPVEVGELAAFEVAA